MVRVRRAFPLPRPIRWPQMLITPVCRPAAARVSARMPDGWRPGRAESAQPQHLLGGERVGAGAQQFAGLEVEEQQRGRFDADPDLASGQDLRGAVLA